MTATGAGDATAETPTATTVVQAPAELLALDGAELGTTDWTEVTQDQVGLFADATGDLEPSTAEPLSGGPIAHSYLTLSLVNLFLPRLLEVRGASMGVNVGLDEVRFPASVPVGSRLRGSGRVVSVAEAKGGVQVTVRITVEVEGSENHACVADTVSRFLP